MGNTYEITEEKKLGAEVTLVEQRAQELTVRTDAEFKAAGEAAKAVKALAKRVKDYWEPMRKSTYEAYCAVNDHKKEMLDPLTAAEKIIKGKMAAYQDMQAKIRAEQEKKMRELAEAEMRKKLDEAKKAEESGDAFAADYARAEAEALGAMAETVVSAKPAAKADGIVQKKAWEITGIDLAKLPCEFGGIVIRPADEAAIMRLIRESKGGITIPGVEYRETVSIAVKA